MPATKRSIPDDVGGPTPQETTHVGIAEIIERIRGFPLGLAIAGAAVATAWVSLSMRSYQQTGHGIDTGLDPAAVALVTPYVIVVALAIVTILVAFPLWIGAIRGVSGRRGGSVTESGGTEQMSPTPCPTPSPPGRRSPRRGSEGR